MLGHYSSMKSRKGLAPDVTDICDAGDVLVMLHRHRLPKGAVLRSVFSRLSNVYF